MHLPQSAPWREPAGPPSLGKSEVHIWLSTLSLHSTAKLEMLLTADEQERAQRFRRAKDREMFVTARGILRSILGHYLAIHPGAIRFAYNQYGRPTVVEPAPGDLQFNVAHSGDLAVYVVAHRQVGIDVEQVRTELDFTGIAANFFSPREQAELQSVPENLRPVAFYNCWTRKEAYIKARGQGLSIPLHTFDVSCRPGEPACLLSVRSAEDSADRWSMQELKLNTAYIGALVVEGTDWIGQYWRYPEDD